MTNHPVLPGPEIEYVPKMVRNDKREFVEEHARSIVWGGRFGLLSLGLFVLLCCALYADWVAWTRPPEIARIVSNDSGFTQVFRNPVPGNAVSDEQQVWSLKEWAHMFYERRGSTATRDLNRSLLFLDTSLSTIVRDEWDKDKLIEMVMKSDKDLEITVEKVNLLPVEIPNSHKAIMDFYTQLRERSTGEFLEKRRYTVSLEYVVVDLNNIKNKATVESLLATNPNGLIIRSLSPPEEIHK